MSTEKLETFIHLALPEELLKPFEAELHRAESECGVDAANAISMKQSDLKSTDLNFGITALAVVVMEWSSQVIAGELLILVLTKAIGALRTKRELKPDQTVSVIVDAKLHQIEILAGDDDATIGKKIRNICGTKE